MDEYIYLEPEFNNPERIRRERKKAQVVKKSQWWLQRLNHGFCYYCTKKFSKSQLTMDHIVPIARGGESGKGNLVVCCIQCNRNKKLGIPAESILLGLQT